MATTTDTPADKKELFNLIRAIVTMLEELARNGGLPAAHLQEHTPFGQALAQAREAVGLDAHPEALRERKRIADAKRG
jgi:hypothetical protein